MYMNTATPETDAASFPTTYNGRHIEVVSGKVARKLERERDEARAALSTALRGCEAARQAIAMADGTLVQIVAERDAWKAKAERVCVWKFSQFSAATECGKQTVPPWLHDPEFGYVMCPFCGGRIMKEEE